jgi:Fe-S cluster assembly iron-binding protein IscA
MALDGPTDSDERFEFPGFAVVVDRELLKTTGKITVDYASTGLRAGLSITAANKLPGAGAGCGGQCG